MPRTHRPYPQEFRQRMLELVRAGRKPEELELEYVATTQAYQLRLQFQEIYRTYSPEVARNRMEAWVRRAGRWASRLGEILEPMRKAAAIVERHLEGILAHWNQKLTTAFMEGLNSVFSATKRKARGYANSLYMITMLYFVAKKLPFPSTITH